MSEQDEGEYRISFDVDAPVHPATKIDMLPQYWLYAGVAPKDATEAFIIRCLAKQNGHHPAVSYVHVREDAAMFFIEDVQAATPFGTMVDARQNARALAAHHRQCGEMLMEVLRIDLYDGELTKVW